MDYALFLLPFVIRPFSARRWGAGLHADMVEVWSVGGKQPSYMM